MQDTLPLLAFLFPLAYSPGPGNMFFAANGARFGLRATLPASLGYHLATWLVTATCGFGALTALTQTPRLFLALKLAGSLYVLWLAWRLFTAGGTGGTTARAKAPRIADGAMLLILNPKAYVIIALMFSQFLSGTGAPEVLRITSLFTVNNLLAFTLWTLLGDRLARHFREEARARMLNRSFGVILAIVALWMLAS